MKNHIAIKFIAVLLCAASLLGVVGSAVGVFALTEMDLYDKTVDQVYQERLQSEGRSMAYDKAMYYACNTLGGCPEPMLEEMHYHADGSSFNNFYYGYRLMDAEGNVLDSRDLTYGESFTTYSFDVTGQYMHLVDTTIKSEQAHAAPETTTMDNGAVIYDAIPAEGTPVSEIQLALLNSSYGSSGDEVGFVFRNQDGQVILRCPGWIIDEHEENAAVTSITLHGVSGELLYDAAWHSGIGVIHAEADGSLKFISFPVADLAAAEPAEETVPMPTAPAEETVPATTAEAVTTPTEIEETTAEAVSDEAESAKDTEEAEPKKDTEESKSEKDPEESETKKDKEESKSEKDTEEGESKKDKEETKSEKDTEEAESRKDKEETKSEKDSEKSESKKDTEETESKESKKESKDADTEEASEAEPAEDGAEATEETTVPTVPETVPEETLPEETIPEVTAPEEPAPVLINGKSLDTYQINRTEYFDYTIGEMVTARYVYVPMPEMTLELYVAPGALAAESSYTVLRIIRSVRSYLFPAMGICLLLFAICAVYLCCAAGRKPKSDDVRPGGLNRIPLDLYGFCMLSCVTGLCLAIAEGGDYLLRQNVMVGCAFTVAMAFLASLLIVGFLFACVAQFKTPGGFWWRNSLCGLSLRLCGWLFKKALRFCVRLEEWASMKGWPLVKRLFGWIWGILKRIGCWCVDRINRFISLLPVTWQWILIGLAMSFFLFITVAGRFDFGMVLSILFAFALVLYGGHCFGVLLETTKKMNKGDLDSKVDDKLMIGAFKEFAGDLNDLAGVAVVAAQKQLKSERMKTELITNVSHDIKTPLTSIINYVDLLQKPHTEEEQDQYLEVLDRQSQRLKKLIDDLMDMSKASTGNMAVDITLVDAVESVNQALGEFGDKLDRAQLTPVFRHTEESVAMMADGRLVWRVLSNLLSNAVKYAMPCTRLYIDLMRLENKVVISLKNISRDELNVDAEELMERFVRGDDSRNTEGSGLGLNIAKSLMELQKGQLQLLVDGDLFKVTLIFPGN